ncbi:fimbrial protein [Pseudomonas kairouanensis]|uniref:Fimbrial protein n=1 Tax=Pseudomonas kairouanensis TaxID=2293832 RepID=A0A4Z0ATY7_9PSED|nr:fimbrial protein [Pseudomonas kairouanensis]TFY89817.1 fimbrial protein [Pseudomonas kairouanensis]
MKPTIKFSSTLLGLGLPITAQALCSSYPNVQYGVTFPSTITVPKSLPVGGMITSRTFDGPFPRLVFRCGTGMFQTWTGRFSSSSSAPGGEIYHTNVPGIGMRIIQADNYESPYSVSLRNGSKTWPSNSTYTHHITTMRAEFFKMGQVTTGTLSAGNLQDSSLDGSRGRIQKRLNNSIRFVNPVATCDLATGDVNRTITLSTVKVSAFNNAVSAGARNFELTANCSDATNVTFRFTGTPATGNTSLFANTGSARGLGLWLYSRIGGTSQTLSNNGTRTVAVSGNRAVLPLGAAYHKNGTVSQGTLASTATVNITYN